MAGAVGPALVAAFSEAGGLGMLPIWEKTPVAAVDDMRALKKMTQRPFGVNLNNNYPQDEHLAAALDEKIRIVSFFGGSTQNGSCVQRTPARWSFRLWGLHLKQAAL